MLSSSNILGSITNKASMRRAPVDQHVPVEVKVHIVKDIRETQGDITETYIKESQRLAELGGIDQKDLPSSTDSSSDDLDRLKERLARILKGWSVLAIVSLLSNNNRHKCDGTGGG